MYQDYFSLKEKPFSITPDPAYLFLSERHAEALAHLVYGITDSGGFIQLTGEVGTGKTTIIRSLLEKLPENVDVALILNPRLNVNEFLHAICDELLIDISSDASNKECFDRLNEFLLDAYANERRVVLLIDEAQNLSVDVLEQVRLLTNLETHKDKLLQIILVGQPELQTLLARQDLRQLAQRITARYHLQPLNKEESAAYLGHRISVAGGNPGIFTAGAKKTIYKAARGIPRIMNVIADRALLGAYSKEKRRVDTQTAKSAIDEVLGVELQRLSNVESAHGMPWKHLLWVVPALALLSFALLNFDGLKKKFFQQDETTAVTQYSSEPDVDANKSPALNSEAANDELQTAAVRNTDAGSALVNENVPSLDKSDAQIGNGENSTITTTSLSELLAAQSPYTSSEYAFNTLLSLWDRPALDAPENPCENVAKYGLRCFFQTGTWADLIAQDRPALLEVVDSAGAPHQLVLEKVDAEQVALRLNTETVVLPVADLLSQWRGNYLLLWKPDEDLPESLYWGVDDAKVIWLRRSLNQLGFVTANTDSSLFDARLVDVVKDFQSANQLDADGIVGSRTFLRLYDALGTGDRPSLTGR